MRIATFNVNSIRARLPLLLDWLAESKPDVVALQELKCTEDQLPREPLEELGYNILVQGQKSYNGVAILSKIPMDDTLIGLPGDDGDEQARYLEATIGTIRVCGFYAPNGNPIGTEKFTYKLAWLDRLAKRAAELRRLEQPIVMLGDYNIIPEPDDVWDPAAVADDALFQPQSRAWYRAMINRGWVDAVAAKPPAAGRYTYWDYQGNRYLRNHGLRIDHILLDPLAADRFLAVEIDRRPRGLDKASDHTPVVLTIDDTVSQ